MADDVRSALLDFYGLPSQEDGTDGEQTQEEKTPSPPVNSDPRDLDSEVFQADLYVSDLLASYSMDKLIAHDNSMIDAKKALDSEMQNLVYDNYNKFISATDTIREMKANVESMETRMNQLWSMMEAISDSSTKIEKRLETNRVKVENLVAVNVLLKRFEFLFELPGRLSKSIEIGAHEQAVKYFRLSSNILKQYKHIKSFEAIRQESEQIIAELKKTLRAQVKNRDNSSEVQLSNASMLIDLEESPESLLTDLFSARKERMKKDIQRCIDTNAVNEKFAKEKLKMNWAIPATEKKSAADEEKPSSKKKDEKEELLHMLHAHFIEPYIVFTQTFLDTFIRPQTSSTVGDRSRAGAMSASGVAAANQKLNKAKQESLEKCNAALIDFTNELFSEYFSVARKELLKIASNEISVAAQSAKNAASSPSPAPAPATSPTSAAAQDEDSEDTSTSPSSRGGNASGSSGSGVQMQRLTKNLAFFYKGLLSPLKQVPKARLGDRASEIIEHTIRHAIESVFERTQREIVNDLKEVYQRLETFDPISAAAAIQKQAESQNDTTSESAAASSSSSSSGAADDGSTNEKSGNGVRRASTSSSLDKLNFPQASSVAAAIRGHLDNGLQLLQPLLSTRDYLPDNFGLSFYILAHSHFYQNLHALSNLFLGKVLRKTEGPVYEGNGRANFSALELELMHSIDARKCPFYFLFCSQLTSYLENGEIVAAIKKLKKLFPINEKQMNLTSLNASLDAQVPQILVKMKETSQLLLQKFVECYSFQITELLRGQYSTVVKYKANSVSAVSPVVGVLHKKLLRLDAELCLIFPKESGKSAINTSGSDKTDSGGSAPTGGGRSMASRLLASGRGGLRNVNRDIERLFTQKVSTFGSVKFTRQDALQAIQRILLKALLEIIRSSMHISGGGFQQLQLDIFAFRRLFGLIFTLAPEDAKLINSMLDECTNAADARCKETSQALDDDKVAALYEKSAQQFNTEQQT